MRVRDAVHDESWSYPVVVGTATIPLTLTILRFTDWTPVIPTVIGGLFLGHHFSNKDISEWRVGGRAGIIGGLAIIPGLFNWTASIPDYSWAAPISIIAGGISLVVGTVYIGIFGIACVASCYAGRWATRNLPKPNLSVAK